MNQDFVDLLRAFVDHNVRFLIVGAYALGVHGRPRATGDLDVWVEPAPDNAARVMQALKQFGAPLEQVTRRRLQSSRHRISDGPSATCGSIY